MNERILTEIASNAIKCINKNRKIHPNETGFYYESLPRTSIFKSLLRKKVSNYQNIKDFYKKASINRLGLMKTLQQAIWEVGDGFWNTFPVEMLYKQLNTKPCFVCSPDFLSNRSFFSFYKVISNKKIVNFIKVFIRHLFCGYVHPMKYLIKCFWIQS